MGALRVRLLTDGSQALDVVLDEIEALLGTRPQVYEPIGASLDSAGDLARTIAEIVDLPATVAGASAVLSRLAGLLQTWIEADAKRIIEIVRPDGSRVRVEGSHARLSEILGGLAAESGLPTDPDSQPT